MKENEFGHLVPFNLKKEIPYTTNTVVQRTIVDKASRIVQLMAFDYGKVLAITSDGTQFHVLIEGKAEMVIDEVSTYLQPGDSIIVPPGTNYTLEANEKFKILTINLE
ncbi:MULTISPECIES: cupin domain-containing protein [Zunongwangia]|uniref:Cupin type-2 domain-containing protein n=2 Tax=Zunongwangia profunda TaxID=398743 RepID=D5BKT4_ZUNPS|nr:cupin domain-containing protein [Zunongwangia profunda]MAG89045.1 cupin domain-containing protein [Flavobacteriaceae bacterium]MAS70787.1 cupin domain-containing protein [Zunongwangia sp.]ADF51833.1 conserved hypothetical protein [Zunongwangia profunda SM-A87]MCC4227661.1 cupin domain-containing protein [Zunongwangia profunda]HCV80753.1 cupin domain-containing protein [Zunongwangia profunda]|tara:strand:- start:259 stop:582 length:324 start_codon:yes stop_codon:yes gene_type:complete